MCVERSNAKAVSAQAPDWARHSLNAGLDSPHPPRFCSTESIVRSRIGPRMRVRAFAFKDGVANVRIGFFYE